VSHSQRMSADTHARADARYSGRLNEFAIRKTNVTITLGLPVFDHHTPKGLVLCGCCTVHRGCYLHFAKKGCTEIRGC